MALTIEADTPCLQLGTFLRDQLNALDTRTVVADLMSYYPFLGGEVAVSSPLLCVFRGNSNGEHLQTSELNIGYYLFDLEAYRLQPGLLRWVEKSISDLLAAYDNGDTGGRFDLASLRSRRGYLPYAGLLLPNTVLTVSFLDFASVC